MTGIQRVTRAQVAEHNSSNSAWICIGNKVYDLTTFLDEHPGGNEVLLRLAGLDGTEAYEDIGHSTDAQHLKENYLVAEIVDAEKITYSYNKKKWFEKEVGGTKDKSDSGAVDPMIYVAFFVSLFAVIYYFLAY